MFRNRHINFGFLSVILVAFVIAMSASCKLAYAGAGKGKPVMIITIDVKTGKLISVRGAVEVTPKKPDEIGRKFDEPSFTLNARGTTPREIIPATFYTHEKSDCIIFYFRGYEYEYCYP